MVTPSTGDWNLTPKFHELIDVSLLDKDKLKEAINRNRSVLSEKLLTQEEEFDMFTRFYHGFLSELNIPEYNKSIAEEIAKDRTYKNDKYTICDNLSEELENLSKKYKLLMLSDNWPCVIPYMKDYNIDKYFDKLYVSSVYGVEKKDGTFFDYPIEDFGIKPGEALFIDDNESNLDIASTKGFDCILMDRYKKDITSKYKIINDLMEL